MKVEEEGFALTIETDACGDLMDESAWRARLEPLSMDLSLREDEDGTQIRLRERRTA
ncbi:MAG: hypothetical protein K6E92_05520 [Lachnospiraceae bacterium]|nr:hypothetical protein [Lachnospiraceae bacterium]